MRAVAIDSLVQGAARAVRRFPFPLVCAWAACALFDLLILGSGNGHDRVFAAGVVLTLGIPLCFAVTLLGERMPAAPETARSMSQLAVLLALVVLALLWPHWTEDIQWRRYVQLSLLAHAVVAFLPYAAVREPNGFWQYNRALLERFVLASIFSSVLFAGLEGALATLRPLFGIEVSGKAYGLLATWIWFGFHPWFFLAGVPSDLAALEDRRDYPGTVRVFAQFVLVPLVAVYQALLTAYLFKVVITGKWPSGLIGWLVSVEAIAGILAILLVHPVRQLAENLWVRTFARGFYIALVPSVVMLALSIAKRVGQYGVTEDRYFVIALTAWLGAISAFFIVRRDGDIRWIPVTLAVLAVITFGGPWGAYHVSLASQRARLVRLLEQNGMWSHGQPVPATGEVSGEARKQLSALLVYMLDRHGSRALAAVLGPVAAAADSGFNDPESAYGRTRAAQVSARLGFAFTDAYSSTSDSLQAFAFDETYTDPRSAGLVEGLEYHVRIDHVVVQAFCAGPRTLGLWVDDDARRVFLADLRGHQDALALKTPVDTLATAPLAPLIAASRARRVPGSPYPRLRLEGRGARAILEVTAISGTERPRFAVDALGGDLYFTLTGPAPDSTRAAAAR